MATSGGVCWALSATFGQYLFQVGGFDAIWLTTVRLLSAGIIMLGISLAKNGKSTFDIWKDKRDIFEIMIYGFLGMAGVLDWKCVLATAGVVLLGTIMSFFCYLEGVRIIGSDLAALYAAVEPLATAVIGIVWFHISFGFIDWIGAAMIVSTVFIISLAPRWQKKEKLPLT